MPARVAVAPKSKGARVPLKEPLGTQFEALRVVLGGGNTEIGVLRDAVAAYIELKLKDRKLRARYEAELAKLMADKVQPLRLIKKDGEEN
jgi:hypothetical protein